MPTLWADPDTNEWVGAVGRSAFAGAVALPDEAKLTWAPPDTTGYTVVNIPTSGYTGTLDHNTDYVLQMPSSPVTDNVWVKGGRNVVMIGGQIEVDTLTETSPGYANEADQHGIYIVRHPTAGVHAGGRIVHIEGVLINGHYLSDGIRTASNDGGPTDVDLRIQNVRIEIGMYYRTDGSPHPDVLQPFGGIGWLRADKFTGLFTGQGLMLKPDFNGPNQGFMQLKRFNLRENANPDTEFNTIAHGVDPRYLWWTDGGESGVRLEKGTVWFNHLQRAFSAAGIQMFWPELTAGGYGSDGAGTWANPTHSAGWDGTGVGFVYEGDPPGGDYVPAGVAGIGYVSPGYVT